MTQDFPETNHRLAQTDVESRLATDEIFRQEVGADFISTGEQELALLRALGLNDGHLVVDVGCGGGRLAYQLAPFKGVKYVGIDVVSSLLSTARDLVHRKDMRFILGDGSTINLSDECADFVCCLSVFEHLHHEDIYRYFIEAHSVLKPGALLVLSFFEFRMPSHWPSFIAGVDNSADPDHLNQFLDRDGISAWASHSKFDVLRIVSGEAGRSLAILQKRKASEISDEYNGPALRAAALGAQNERLVRLTNTSTRTFIGTGENAYVQGLVLTGLGTKSFLIRAVGPTLSDFKVKMRLSAPEIIVHASNGKLVAHRRGWHASLVEAFSLVGAFALPKGSEDAALVVTLLEGNYTISVTGSTPGVALVEVYELPSAYYPL